MDAPAVPTLWWYALNISDESNEIPMPNLKWVPYRFMGTFDTSVYNFVLQISERKQWVQQFQLPAGNN